MMKFTKMQVIGDPQVKGYSSSKTQLQPSQLGSCYMYYHYLTGIYLSYLGPLYA